MLESEIPSNDQSRRMEAVVTIWGEDGKLYMPTADPISGNFTIIDHQHDKLHDGGRFLAAKIGTLANGASLAFLFLTGNLESHLICRVSSDQGMSEQIFEAPTKSANGTQITSYNKRRSSSTTPQSSVYSGPTVSNNGNLLSAEIIGSFKVSGSTRSEDEIVLAKSTAYLVLITNISSQTCNYACEFDWYET